jgi:hypothetical protein
MLKLPVDKRSPRLTEQKISHLETVIIALLLKICDCDAELVVSRHTATLYELEPWGRIENNSTRPIEEGFRWTVVPQHVEQTTQFCTHLR